MGKTVILRVGIRALLGASIGGPTLVVADVGLTFGELPGLAEFLTISAAMMPVTLPCGCAWAVSALLIKRSKRERWTSAKWGWTGALLGLAIGPTATTLFQALTAGDSWRLAIEGSWRLIRLATVAGGIVGGVVGWMSSDDLEGTSRGM